MSANALVVAIITITITTITMWGDKPGAPSQGLPTFAMRMLFVIMFTIIVVLAALKFVNETLVFVVVTCILLFIYMLKLTLFESRKQVFLPARSGRTHSLKEAPRANGSTLTTPQIRPRPF